MQFTLTPALLSTPAIVGRDIFMHRHPIRGCCEKPVAQMRQQFGRKVKLVDDAHRGVLHRHYAMPTAHHGIL